MEGASFQKWQELSSLSDVRRWGGCSSLGHCSLEVQPLGGQGPRDVGVLAFPLHVGPGACFLLESARGGQTRLRHTCLSGAQN